MVQKQVNRIEFEYMSIHLVTKSTKMINYTSVGMVEKEKGS